jgi:hypothetical protein
VVHCILIGRVSDNRTREALQVEMVSLSTRLDELVSYSGLPAYSTIRRSARGYSSGIVG